MLLLLTQLCTLKLQLTHTPSTRLTCLCLMRRSTFQRTLMPFLLLDTDQNMCQFTLIWLLLLTSMLRTLLRLLTLNTHTCFQPVILTLLTFLATSPRLTFPELQFLTHFTTTLKSLITLTPT